MLSANRAISNAALADASTELKSTPLTFPAYSTSGSARVARFAAKTTIGLSPTILDSKPPWLGICLANSAIIFAALADASTPLKSTPLTSSAYCLSFGAASDISVANTAKLTPPPNIDAIPLTILEPVRMSIVSARPLIPLIALSSICFAPSIKPWRLAMKSLRP